MPAVRGSRWGEIRGLQLATVMSGDWEMSRLVTEVGNQYYSSGQKCEVLGLFVIIYSFFCCLFPKFLELIPKVWFTSIPALINMQHEKGHEQCHNACVSNLDQVIAKSTKGSVIQACLVLLVSHGYRQRACFTQHHNVQVKQQSKERGKTQPQIGYCLVCVSVNKVSGTGDTGEAGDIDP